ncbi:hypothetical protein [Streptomyces sp. NPDC055210]
MRRQMMLRNPILVFMAIVSLVLVYVVTSADAASAKRKPPKKNESLAELVDGYQPPASFTCPYMEKWGTTVVEDWLCGPPKGRGVVFLAEMLKPSDVGTPPPSDEGWKYLAVPSEFSCALTTGEPADLAKSYGCRYVHRHDNGKKYSHTFRLNETVFAHTVDPPDIYGWYLPHPSN